ncbi:hypothetical protein OKW21_006739 [Catalinimonas alkaloidigena]|uniref:DUF7668 domain-containing protein n=1 Tax=Catalinimonas alkaloidigena TaxID=1075417 RepID=UPI00240623DC|nr:hypothetical protein [Catalinimonas alkaloidigena]MDF9801430.1 hypothetical protein [Catalinimonas alkaloidigena]
MKDEEKEITEIIRNWIKLLSENRLEEASKQIANDANQFWTEDRLKAVVFTDKNFKIENPYEMNPEGERVEIYEFDDNSGWAVEYDLPIEKRWSDLTAQFTFRKNKGKMDFTLEDIHVL